MRIPGTIGDKLFFLSKSSSESKSESEAITPVIGSLLLVVVTVALVGTVASVFTFSGNGAFSQTPIAKITLESCEGGLCHAPKGENATFENNKIVLVHEGGSPLPLDTTCIRISGYGNSYRAIFGQGFIKGNITVLYRDMTSGGKNPRYKVRNNAVLENYLWEAGEKLALSGQDSSVKAIDSSVKVSVDGEENTSDNYGFKVGSEIMLKVVDIKSNNIISEQTVVVKHAD